MSDYTKTTNFTAKDALTTGDPAKIVKGSEHDTEYNAIAVAIATKVDQVGTGLALAAKTVSLDITNMTAETVVDVTNDLVAVYDASAGAGRKVALTYITQAGLAARTLTAGTGISGGGTLDADRTVALDLSELGVETTAVTGDYIAMVDVTDNGSQIITFGNFATVMQTLMNHDSITGFVSNEHIDHSAVSITAGTGLSGGGTIAATRTLNLDISGLTAMSATPVGTDGFLYDDGGTMKRMSYNQLAFPSRNVSTSGNFASTDVGTVVYWTGTSGTLTMPTGIGQDEAAIIVINSGSGTLTIAGSGVTITSANSLTSIPAGGMACLIRETSTVWFLGGSLE